MSGDLTPHVCFGPFSSSLFLIFRQQATTDPAPTQPSSIATVITMLSNTLLRTASRRAASAVSAQSTRTASSQAFKRASEQASRNNILPIMTVATMCGWGLVTMKSQEEEMESKTAQCLFNRTNSQAKEVEDKFATYWPRNIMILFGPPGVCRRCCA